MTSFNLGSLCRLMGLDDVEYEVLLKRKGQSKASKSGVRTKRAVAERLEKYYRKEYKNLRIQFPNIKRGGILKKLLTIAESCPKENRRKASSLKKYTKGLQ